MSPLQRCVNQQEVFQSVTGETNANLEQVEKKENPTAQNERS